ncbi:MAG TPA: hypothetical protein VJI13_01535 [Candidatus Norongarragalinales archaeon]|nr:hypothetical protein [Candidatus Norongarragalinales archaeon]
MAMNKLIIAGLVIVLVIGGLVVFTSSLPGEYDKFAQCLSNKDATMYGAYWCSHCANQKKMLGNSFKYVNYVECDSAGPNGKPDLCRQKGITGYPTWIIGNQTYEGEQNLQTLSALTGCPLVAS